LLEKAINLSKGALNVQAASRTVKQLDRLKRISAIIMR